MRSLRATALLLALGACTGNGANEGFDVDFEQPETQVDYDVALEGSPTPEVTNLAEQSLALFRRRDDGAQSLAFLRRRANGDVETMQRILRAFGYYEAEIEVEIEPPRTERVEPRDLDGDGVPDTPSERRVPALARLVIEPGSAFILASHELVFAESDAPPPEPLDAAELGSPVGDVARAEPITAAESAAVARLRGTGRPYASFSGREAVADLEENTIEVDSTVDAGPPFVFGEVVFEGAPNVDESYLRTYIPWQEGETFDTRKLRAYQQELIDTTLFAAATVAPPDEPPEGEAAPVIVDLEEAPFRTVRAGARFSTDAGPGIRLGFEHRNLFGANEQIRLSFDGDLDEQEIVAGFTKPQFLRPGQFLDAEFRTFRLEDSPYDAVGFTTTAGLRREIGERWEIGAGGLYEFARINERDRPDSTASIFGVPAFIAYDSTTSLLDPRRGQRARLTVTPFAGTFREEGTAFLRIEGRGSAYQPLVPSERFVLAERVRLGTIVADSVEDVPQTRRFYAGGGGSVRGYERYLVGPLDRFNDPVGGLSVAEAALELRARIWNDIGGVVFVDGGTVSTDSGFAFDDDFLIASGFGIRYFSPVGPIRLDVAFPVNGRDVDDTFQLYFSIGQAF